MTSLDMDGPFDLTDKTIDSKVPAQLIGNFALGYINKNNKFVVKVVGRADADLRREIKAAQRQYAGGFLARLFGGGTLDKFKFSFANTADAAYQVECRIFETFGGTEKLLNKQPPTPP